MLGQFGVTGRKQIAGRTCNSLQECFNANNITSSGTESKEILRMFSKH
jgi:hypothetical protein